MHSNQLIINFWAGAGPCSFCWAGAGPFLFWPGAGPFEKNISDFLAFLFYQFWLISVCILCRKNTNLVLKYPVFVKTFKNTKKFEKKKKKMFLCIQPSVSKLKNHIVFFHTPKNNVLTCILALITSLLKSREHWPKFQKTTKILFCLSLNIRGMTLHVMRIPDI